MRWLSKLTRDWLRQSARKPFYEVIKEAKISPRQMKIIEMKFVEGKYNYQIAMELNISDKLVEKEVSTAYKSISRILDNI